jgi:ABC-type polar amino acid transport system ATPase subunit
VGDVGDVMMGVGPVPAASVRDLVDLLGIGDKAAQSPGVLSGGQRLRVADAGMSTEMS